MGRLRPRERALLWLAYARATRTRRSRETLGVKTGSVKLLLFRARRKLATLLRGSPATAADGGPIVRTIECSREQDVHRRAVERPVAGTRAW